MAIALQSVVGYNNTSDRTTWNVGSIVVISGGTDRLMVVDATTEDSSGGVDIVVQSVILDPAGLAINLTKAIEDQIVTSGTWGNSSSMWYLLDADFPADGTYDLEITYAGQTTEIGASVRIYTGVKQGAPEATASNTALSTTTVSASITTLTDGAWVMDTACHGDGVATWSADAAQTERDVRDADSHWHGASDKSVATAGATSMSWTASASVNRLVVVAAAWAPASTGGSITNRTISDSLGVSDDLPVIQRKLSRQVSDGITVADSLASLREVFKRLADGMPVTDSLSVSLINIVVKEVLLSDGIDVTDDSSAYLNLFRSVASALIVTDKAPVFRQFVRLLANQIDVSDEIVRQVTTGVRSVLLTDSFDVVDGANVYRELMRLIDSNAPVTDSLDKYAALSRVLQDSMTLSDVTMSERNAVRMVLSTIQVTTDLFRSLNLSRNITDNTPVSDDLTREAIHFYERLLIDSLGVSDALGISLSRAIAAWGIILSGMGEESIEAKAMHEKIIAAILSNLAKGDTEQ